jgi:hypothetical protein
MRLCRHPVSLRSRVSLRFEGLDQSVKDDGLNGEQLKVVGTLGTCTMHDAWSVELRRINRNKKITLAKIYWNNQTLDAWANQLLSETDNRATLTFLSSSLYRESNGYQYMGPAMKVYILCVSWDIVRKFTFAFHGLRSFISGGIPKGGKWLCGPPCQIFCTHSYCSPLGIPNHSIARDTIFGTQKMQVWHVLGP